MYAIIRTGGKQAKVREGDVIDVERLRAEGKVEFTPLLVVDDNGTVFSRREQLKSAKVEATVVGDSAGDKIDIFKYKAKTGYRRRQGHRQRYTAIEITKIKPPTTRRQEAAEEEAPTDAPEQAPSRETTAEKPAAGSTSGKKTSSAESTAAKKPAAKKPVAKKASSTTKSAAAKKSSAKSTAAGKTTTAGKKATSTRKSATKKPSSSRTSKSKES